jgi:hypothetical protein
VLFGWSKCFVSFHYDIQFFGVFPNLETLNERLTKDGYVGAVNDAGDTTPRISDEEILRLWALGNTWRCNVREP